MAQTYTDKSKGVKITVSSNKKKVATPRNKFQKRLIKVNRDAGMNQQRVMNLLLMKLTMEIREKEMTASRNPLFVPVNEWRDIENAQRELQVLEKSYEDTQIALQFLKEDLTAIQTGQGTSLERYNNFVNPPAAPPPSPSGGATAPTGGPPVAPVSGVRAEPDSSAFYNPDDFKAYLQEHLKGRAAQKWKTYITPGGTLKLKVREKYGLNLYDFEGLYNALNTLDVWKT